jgi:hypothetical protein
MALAITYSATLSALAPVAGITFGCRGLAARHVDVVQPHAEPAHHLAAGERVEQLAAHLRQVAHDQRIGPWPLRRYRRAASSTRATS